MSGPGRWKTFYDREQEACYFLKMNTRIQVEHPVTQAITGVDLVAAQIRLALGEKLEEMCQQQDIRQSGCSVEARLYAENPAKGFLPSPGPLTRFRLPQQEGIRCDTGYREGNEVTPHYDPLVAKIIAHAPTRYQALDRLVDALQATEVEGVATNRDFLIDCLNSADMRRVNIHTRSIEG